jgi:hypothetical protein
MSDQDPFSPQSEYPRYEIKVVGAAHDLPSISAWVRLHPLHWRVAYPPRQVNNIYFDTDDGQNLNDNLAGTGSRCKLRLRWYGSRLTSVTGAYLELKCKEGAVGWKEVWLLALDLNLAHQPWAELYPAIRRAADARANLWLAQFSRPMLINYYQRAYYVTSDCVARLTIDSKLHFYDQRFAAYPNLRSPTLLADHVVVEFKVNRQHYSRIAEALASFPLRPEHCSKYVRGMLAACYAP